LTPDTPFGPGMPAQTLRQIGVSRPGNFQVDDGFSADVRLMNSLALRSLSWLFDEKEKLFPDRVTLVKDGYLRDRVSQKHTVIALLGLHRFAESGETLPFDTRAIQDAVFRDRSWVKSAEDLGLLTWLAAVRLPDRLGAVIDEFSFRTALTNYEDGRQGRTVGLAWFLAGIAHAALAQPARVSELTDVAVDVYRLLQGNQSRNGIFGHAASARFPTDAVCSRFGTFYDQVSAIYALSAFAKAFQIEEPLESALASANSICALQGDLGQWWFLYDKNTGCVVSRYPVLSVHQDGVAPSALMALGEATGRSFDPAILKGLSWITGANEMGVDLRSQDPASIWDSMDFEKRIARYWDAALSFVNISRQGRVDGLTIRHEARPDHFGWLLNAFGKFGLPNSRSFASHA
jgi:hypothetical protein